MRSRAAILPYPADPFLLHYWLHFFNTVWGDEIDKLYIYLNSPIEPAVVFYIKELCRENPKINLTYEDKQIEHGDAIDRTLDIVTEKYVMLIEDDGFIFKKGMVDKCFSYLESGNYDIVGSKRGSCAFEILKAAEFKWGIPYSGEGDQGCNFWPCYFFCETDLLRKTDRNFKAKAWTDGETIEALNYTVDVPVIYGDTFVNTSLQLHAMIPESRIMYVPQYHGHPSDIEHAQQGKYLFDGMAPWTHVGSLSSGVGGLLKDGYNRALARRLIDPAEEKTVLNKEWCKSDMEREEFERRVQWWLTFWEKRDLYKITEFADLYYKAINQIIEQYALRIKEIRKRQGVYQSLLGI